MPKLFGRVFVNCHSQLELREWNLQHHGNPQTRRMWPEVLAKKWSLVTNALKSSLSRLVWPGRRWEWPGRRFNILLPLVVAPLSLWDVYRCCWVVLFEGRWGKRNFARPWVGFLLLVKDHDRYMKLWYETKWNSIQYETLYNRPYKSQDPHETSPSPWKKWKTPFQPGNNT